MKLAVTGKGGAGKTTLAAGLAVLLSQEGLSVVAVDADPDANLALALGASPSAADSVVPLSQMQDLVRERMGAAGGEGGGFVALNPKVDDIAASYGTKIGRVSLLVLGAVRKGGAGCACPENVLLQSLLEHLLVESDHALIADMEAGIEHLGRATARGVDMLLIVAEPTAAAVHTAQTIARLARETGIDRLGLVLNKVRRPEQIDEVVAAVPDVPFLGSLPWSEEQAAAGLNTVAVSDGPLLADIARIKKHIQADLASA